MQQGGPNWFVELGRRDGVVSSAAEATALLPSSHSDAQSLIAAFATLNLTSQDLVTLSGEPNHTYISTYLPLDSQQIKKMRKKERKKERERVGCCSLFCAFATKHFDYNSLDEV